MGGINKIKQCWEEYIPKNIRIFLSSKRTLIVLILINISLCSIAISFNNYIPHVLFGKENAEAKGKMLTTCLSIMGGLTVLYGLWLNNKKLNEQTRQNDITVESNNDKRFGEAVGYLNSDNVGIAIGGVYALFQIAKEDKRYVSIVANIFCEYIVDKPNDSPPHAPIVNNLIVKLVLDSGYSVFKSEELVFHDASFSNLQTAKKISNIKFQKCKLNIITFDKEVSNIIFQECKLEMVTFDKEVSNMKFQECKLETVTFDRAKNVKFETCELKNCSYLDCSTFIVRNCEIYNIDIVNYLIPLTNVSLIDISVDKCKIESKIEINSLNIDCLSILNPININAPRGKINILLRRSEQIQDENPIPKVIIKMEDCENVKITGGERFVEFIQDSKIWNYP